MNLINRNKRMLGVWAVLFGALSMSASAATSPVASYRLDESAGSTAADSAGANDGTVINAAQVTQGAAGMFGKAYDFSVSGGVNGGVNFGTAPAVQPNDDFTITLWMNATVLNEFDRLIEAMPGIATTDKGYRLDLGGAPGDSVRVLIRDGTGATASIQNGLNMSTNQWYFVAVRFDKDAASDQLMLTVLDQADAPAAANILAGTNSANIAASLKTNGVLYQSGYETTLASKDASGTGEPANGFKGRLDDVAFYGSVLTDAELNFVRRFGSQTAMPTIGWDAADPTAALTTTWASNIGAARTFNLAAGDSTVPTVVGVSGTTYRIPEAYEFFGGTSMARLPDPSGTNGLPNRSQDATLEIWARPNDLAGQEILFEAGGDASGFSILLDGDQLKL